MKMIKIIKKTQILQKIPKVKKLKKKVYTNRIKPFPVTGEYAYIPEGDLRTLARPIDNVRLLEDNPRINTSAAKKLAKLIKKNGFRKPIVINQDDEIKAGNTTYKAALILKMKNIPAVKSAWITNKEEWDYVLSDNRANEFSEWDKDVLSKLMTEGQVLKDQGEDNATGFTDRELSSIANFTGTGKNNNSDANGLPYSKEEIIDNLFSEFRLKGFPYPELSIAECKQQINKLYLTPSRACLNSNAAYRVVDTYSRHRFDSLAYGKYSIKSRFNDDKALRKAIKHTLHYDSIVKYRYLSYFGMVNGAQSCNHLRPAFVKMLFNEFAPENGTVFSPCMGYGGDFVGFLGSHCKKFYGNDVSKESYKSHLAMGRDLCPDNKNFTFFNVPIETFQSQLYVKKCDFAFTSPPYFCREQYDESNLQSYKKFPLYKDWLNGFLRVMFLKINRVLKMNSLFLVNIADINHNNLKYSLVKDTIRIAKTAGFCYLKSEIYPLGTRTRIKYFNKETKDTEITKDKRQESILFFKKTSIDPETIKYTTK